jgi:integrase
MDTQKQTRTRGRDLLSDAAIRAAKPNDKPHKLSDGGGLHLLVTPSGAKLWRLRFLHPTKRTPDGRRYESMLSLGPYPEVSLSKARERALKERTLVEGGVDPAEERRREKRGNTFEAIAREWLDKQQKVLAPITYDRTVQRFERLIFPEIGARPIASLRLKDITDLLSAIDKAGTHEEARRVYQRISRVFQYAKAKGDVAANIALDVDRKEILTPRGKVKHHAAITDPVRIGQLLRDIDGYAGHGVTLYALKLAPYLFVRPGELRHAEWAEFDLDSAEPKWTIPAEKMKMRREHIVPLAKQAVVLLRDVRMLTGKGRYVFPALTTPSRPMSENTENTAIRRLGYDNTQMTAHGFRTMASTRLNEGFGKHRFKSDWIEMQLAHGEEDSSRAAYNAAEYLDKRRRMMQAYADYLDTLRAERPVKAAA